jgi:hypothetical protein
LINVSRFPAVNISYCFSRVLSLPEALVASFTYLTPNIKVSILSFENRVLFAEEFCILTLYYCESKSIAFRVENII